MMVLDYPRVRAVVLVVEDEMLLRMRAVDMVEEAIPPSRPSMLPQPSPSSSRAPTQLCCLRTSRCRAAIPADSRFFGKPLEAKATIAEIQEMIGHA